MKYRAFCLPYAQLLRIRITHSVGLLCVSSTLRIADVARVGIGGVGGAAANQRRTACNIFGG